MTHITGLESREDLRKHIPDAISGTERLSVKTHRIPEYEEQGWRLLRKGKAVSTIVKDLSEDKKYELKVWYMCYLLGFKTLSIPIKGAIVTREQGVKNQIDVLAISEDIAFVFECKSSCSSKSFDANTLVPKLKDLVDETRESLKLSEHKQGKVKGVFCLSGIRLTTGDRSRIGQSRQKAIDESTIDYYIELAKRVGQVAYYQFLGEVIPGEEIPTLKDKKVPCVKTKIGSSDAYQLVLTPSLLLKIAYVSHRAGGKDDSYQRMVSKSRIKSIQDFIDKGGYFPTNIIVNFRNQSNLPRFEPAPGEYGGDGGSRFGMLILPSSYGCAWVIDGQHRLMSYAGHQRADTAILPVTAFVGMIEETEARLFEDINSKQKKVSAGLLSELYATLHMNSQNDKYKIKAMASSTVNRLKRNPKGCFGKNIKGSDEKQTHVRCITVYQFVNELSKLGLFARKMNGEKAQSWGPFWEGDTYASVDRAVHILEDWFEVIKSNAEQEWSQGEEGIVATNRGVAACLTLLIDICTFLRKHDPDFDTLSTEEISIKIKPYAEYIGQAFKKLRLTDFEVARKRFGSGAIPEYKYIIIKFIKSSYEAEFESDGYEKWMADKLIINIDEAMSLVREIENGISKYIRKVLTEQYSDPWREVPPQIRSEAGSRKEAEDPNGDIWLYLNFINYREIIRKQWQHFQGKMAYDKPSKDDGTSWLVKLNDIRNDTYHAAGNRLTIEQIQQLRIYKEWLIASGVISS